MILIKAWHETLDLSSLGMIVAAGIAIIPLAGKLFKPGESNRENGALIFLSVVIMLLSLFARNEELEEEHLQRIASEKKAQEKSEKDSMRFTIDTLKQEGVLAQLRNRITVDSLRHIAYLYRFDTSRINQLKTIDSVTKVLALQDESLKQMTGGDAYAQILFNRRWQHFDSSIMGLRFTYDFNLINKGVYPLSEIKIQMQQLTENGNIPIINDVIPFLGADVQKSTDRYFFTSLQNTEYLFRKVMTDKDTVLYYEAYIAQRNDQLVQQIILRRLPKHMQGIWWTEATRLFSTRRNKVILEKVDKRYERQYGKVSWAVFGGLPFILNTN